MRLLICQTPKLVYTRAVELLSREVDGQGVDIVLLPEMAVEHPPQCTDQGVLTRENVGIMMLARFAARHQIYVVLGSMEEYVPKDGGLFNTCVVLGPDGDVVMRHRKAAWDPALGDEQLGLFETRFGPVGVLVGREAEEDARVDALLARRPCLLLSPVNSPARMEADLVRMRPELQVAEWHEGFRRVEQRVAAQTRRWPPCPVARADAPLGEGGSGTSMLVEGHRSVLAPGWGAGFFLVETTPPEGPEPARLPGWRRMTVEERIDAAVQGGLHLPDEEAEHGPRYRVWNLQLPRALPLRVPGDAPAPFRAQGPRAERGAVSGEAFARVRSQAAAGAAPPGAFLELLRAKDSRMQYVVVTCHGSMAQWDVALKTAAFSCELGQEALVTAVGPSYAPRQFIVGAATREALLLRVFEERAPAAGAVLQKRSLPWSLWPGGTAELWCAPTSPTGRSSGASSQLSTTSAAEQDEEAPSGARIRAVFHLKASLALAVLEDGDKEGAGLPLCLLVDLGGAAPPRQLDIYGECPADGYEPGARRSLPPGLVDVDELEGTLGGATTAALPGGADRLVACELLTQRFQERRDAGAQQALLCLYRSSRVCVVTLQDLEAHSQLLFEEAANDRERSDVPVCCAACHDPDAGSAHVVVGYASMAVRWWQVSLGQCRLLTQVLLACPVQHLALQASPPPDEAAGDAGPAVGGPAGRRAKPPGRPDVAGVGAAAKPASLLVVGLDRSGALVLLVGRAGRSIARLHVCRQLCLPPQGLRVERLRCWERGVAVLLSSGEVRHIEVAVGGGVAELTDLHAEA